MTNGFPLGIEFPNEGFVQASIEAHFSGLGFVPMKSGHADFACIHPDSGECWRIEAKGATKAVGLDFRTGLGQILQGMTDDSIKYAMAVPDTDQFLRQAALVGEWVRKRLGLHFLIINAHGNVRTVDPSSTFETYNRS